TDVARHRALANRADKISSRLWFPESDPREERLNVVLVDGCDLRAPRWHGHKGTTATTMTSRTADHCLHRRTVVRCSSSRGIFVSRLSSIISTTIAIQSADHCLSFGDFLRLSTWAATPAANSRLVPSNRIR